MLNNLLKTSQALLGLAALVGFAVYAQEADNKDPLVFDVASVKPSVGTCPPVCGLIRPTVGTGGYHIEGAPLRLIMTVAYTVTDRQITGGPAWMNTDRFDIEAKAERSRTTDELHVMLQHLLEERFHMTIRREPRQESVWNMVVAKDGHKMTAHDPDDKDYPPIGGQAAKTSDGGICPGFVGKNVRMDYLAFFLSRGMDRMIIDKTGLTGRWDINLQYLPEALRQAAEAGNTPAVSAECVDLAAALPRQLGLRLEAAKGPVDFLVVDHLEKPSGN
jgi:uncharacterized protein (TIGR03435 family)